MPVGSPLRKHSVDFGGMGTMARRMVGVGTALAVAVSMAAIAGVTASPANAAASINIDDPGAPTAGTVKVTGKVGAAADGVTSVLYVMDASGSTRRSAGSDCSGNGAAGPEDDFNRGAEEARGIVSVGDILDCEISGVLALNRSLPSAGVQVGLVGLAGSAAAADVDPAAGSTAFVAPHFTGGDPRPRIESVATSVTRTQIGLYEFRDLVDDGSNFNDAVDVALSTLGSAPAGPKWIMFLSDGAGGVDDARLERLRQSGVRLRSFDIGDNASCERFASLYKMATATGETCEVVPNPASLAAALTGSQPESVNGVTVTINDVSVAASLDALGGWSANFTLGAGTYTATARASLASGGTVSTQRTFTVASSAAGPPPGSVAAGPGSLKATAIKVNKPKPTRKTLPASVTGRVGLFTKRFETTKNLAGSRVVLEARKAAGTPWQAVDSDKVSQSGDFVLKWKVKKSMTKLRAVLQPYQAYAGSIATVPAAAISGCKVTKRGSGWSLKCSTTAKKGSRVRLLRNGKATSFSRVRDGGVFYLRGTGPIGAFVVDVTAGKRHIRLPL